MLKSGHRSSALVILGWRPAILKNPNNPLSFYLQWAVTSLSLPIMGLRKIIKVNVHFFMPCTENDDEVSVLWNYDVHQKQGYKCTLPENAQRLQNVFISQLSFTFCNKILLFAFIFVFCFSNFLFYFKVFKHLLKQCCSSWCFS